MIPATAELRDAGFPGLLRFYREHGGITNIITDDGRVTSTEKYNA